jgi:HlyD family secretion protein
MTRFKLVPVFAFFLLLTGCGQSGPKPWLGYAEGEDAFIGAPQPGWIASIAVHRGDVVKTGDVLFTLDDTQQLALRDEAKATLAAARAQLQQTQAKLAYATKELRRQRSLVHARAGTRAALDLAQNNYDETTAQIEQIKAQEHAAKATLDNAEYQLSERKVIARVGGRIEDIYFRKGEYAPASTPVISLLPPQNVFVRFFVPEKEFANVKMGQRVRISCDSCAKNMTAQITFIAQQEEFTPPVIFSIANREKLVFKLEARAKGGLALNPGQPVDVSPLR